MQILLIESDNELRQRWLERLQKKAAKIKAVGTLFDASIALERTCYTLVLCGSTAQADERECTIEDVVSQALQSCHLTVSLSNREDHCSVYQLGFQECLDYDCSDEELAAKLALACQTEKLQKRLAQAQKLESIGELAAGIAHEINTPIQYVGDNTRFIQSACEEINSILEVCQNLIASTANSEVQSSATEKLKMAMEEADVEYLVEEIPTAIKQSLEGVDRVANIVRAMKEFAHPGVSEMTPIDLSKAIENTVMVARNEWKYVADLDTVFDPNLPLVPCLPGELNQVLLNMIVNAAHAIADKLGDSPDQKGRIRITTALSKPHAEIRIADTGGGIPKENIERVFTPFFTTKAAGKGTGQGLAIAHAVITEKHQGTIQVQSEVGKGTVFVIRIPLEVAKQPLDDAMGDRELAATSQVGDER